MIRACAIALTSALLQVAVPSAAAPVSLDLDLNSLRKNAFPIRTLRSDCRTIGVTESPAAAYSVSIRYTEERKGEYQLFDRTKPAVLGTEITYEVVVTRVVDSSLLGKMNAQFHPGKYLTLLLPRGTAARETDIYEYVFNSFKDSPEFRLTCSFIAAAQGSVSAYRRLLKWAVAQERGLLAVNALKIDPTSDAEVAAMRLATRDFEENTPFTREASEYLAVFVESHFRESEFGRASPNELDSNQRRAVRLLAFALSELMNSNPARSRSLLPSLLGDMDSTLSEGRSDKDVMRLFAVVYENLARLSLGCAQVGATVKWIGRRSDEIGQQARDQAAKMGCR